MVSPQTSDLTGTCKSFQKRLFIQVEAPEVISEHEEFDFSDVFGPSPVQAAAEVSLNSDSSDPVLDSNDVVYDDPVVICNRSHSLVGPTTCVSQPLSLSKLTLHETESSLELVVECVNGERLAEIQEATVDDSAENSLDIGNHQSVKSQGVGLEDFEIMKVVGQGAFGKVFQVRKKGTSEIYAMKVMRKDKIMEKNHAEYMKAERDILTKIDHPFVVQLRYSFQVTSFIINLK